ncbi:unnamed protein product, partial [marine sediment metagenome]
YISAGHELPLLIRPGEGIVEINGNGRFIGMIENLELKEFEVTIKTGDRMLIFSDGVPDATNMDGVQYGYDRLKRFLNRQQGVAIQQMIDLLAADIAAWTGNAPPFDDLTLLGVEVLDGHGEVSTSY